MLLKFRHPHITLRLYVISVVDHIVSSFHFQRFYYIVSNYHHYFVRQLKVMIDLTLELWWTPVVILFLFPRVFPYLELVFSLKKELLFSPFTVHASYILLLDLVHSEYLPNACHVILEILE